MFQLTVLCLVYFIQWSKCGTLQDAELIPEEMRTPGSELLGKSLSLGIGNSARQRRNFHLPELRVDQEESASGLHGYSGPRVSQLYGAQDRGALQGYSGAEGNQYGASQGYSGAEGSRYGAEDRGVSQGEVGFYGRAGKKGSSGHSADEEYRDAQRASHDDRSDAGHYDARVGVDKEHDLAKVYQGAQGASRHGEGVQRVGSKGGHRKGHHKSGFTNSYHKDESGNKSDFYDDDEDEAQHFQLNARDGSFYDVAAENERAKFRDAALQKEARANRGNYDQGHNFADRQGQKGNFGQGRYFDDKLDYGNRKVGRRYDQVVREAGEKQGVNRLENEGQIYNQQQAYQPQPYQPQPYQPQPVAVVPVRSYYPVNEPVGLDYYPAHVESASYYPSKPSTASYPVRGVALLEDTRATPKYYAPPPRDVYYTPSGY